MTTDFNPKPLFDYDYCAACFDPVHPGTQCIALDAFNTACGCDESITEAERGVKLVTGPTCSLCGDDDVVPGRTAGLCMRCYVLELPYTVEQQLATYKAAYLQMQEEIDNLKHQLQMETHNPTINGAGDYCCAHHETWRT